ncbi:MAG: mannonate dehydratase [Saprospiraceae bacterium]|nr:mannonate dehydratase [Saprospiraceae bacterium]
MKRRNFVRGVAAGSLGTAAFGAAEARSVTKDKPGKRKVLMKVGCQSGGTTIENLEFKARHGVYNIDGGMPKIIEGVGWDLDDSYRMRDACEKYGISLDAYHLPLTSAGIDRVKYPNMMLGKSPERDREIEIIQQMIEVAGKTGVGLLNYNTTIHRVLRTEPTPDPKRGGAVYSTWDYEEAVKMNQPKTIAGDVSVDEVFERIKYVLDRIIPVAEEYKVKLGNHIADPPTPVGFRGITRWNSPDVFAGMKRFAELSDSPYHGFNFCIGSIAEGLKDPKTEILPIIKYFGERNQIFNIHLRNIKGGWNHFQEVYPDNGDMDFLEVIRALRDVGYEGMVMPDHVPKHAAEGSSLQAFAFVYGYIIAMLQVVRSEEMS